MALRNGFLVLFFAPLRILSFSVSAEASALAPLLDGLADELSKDFPVEREVIEGALESALAAAGATEGLSAADLSCVRDYSLPCPSGWIDVGNGETCKVPVNYGGSCPSEVSFGGMAPSAKAALAVKCSATFPCADTTFAATYARRGKRASQTRDHDATTARVNRTCVLDRDAACPVGWLSVGGGICRAPPTYQGACARAFDFSNYDAAQKRVHGELCSAPWPCARGAFFARGAALGASMLGITVRNTGEEDESVQHLKGASKLFDAASSQQDTAEEKAIHAELAGALSSPAQLGAPEHEIPVPAGSSCLSDLTKCPVGWQKQGSLCRAGSGYTGPCVPEMHLSVMTEDEKFAYAHVCGVVFPCA